MLYHDSRWHSSMYLRLMSPTVQSRSSTMNTYLTVSTSIGSIDIEMLNGQKVLFRVHNRKSFLWVVKWVEPYLCIAIPIMCTPPTPKLISQTWEYCCSVVLFEKEKITYCNKWQFGKKRHRGAKLIDKNGQSTNIRRCQIQSHPQPKLGHCGLLQRPLEPALDKLLVMGQMLGGALAYVPSSHGEAPEATSVPWQSMA